MAYYAFANKIGHNKENALIIQISGWVGMFLIVAAYFLNSRKLLDSQSRAYQFINLAGSVGVGINVYHQQAWPAVALQVVWCAIALTTLWKSPKA